MLLHHFRLVYGLDSNGRLCGTKTPDLDLSAMPNLYYLNPLSSTGYRICLNTCPSVSGAVICRYDASNVNLTAPLDYNQFVAGNCSLTSASTAGTFLRRLVYSCSSHYQLHQFSIDAFHKLWPYSIHPPIPPPFPPTRRNSRLQVRKYFPARHLRTRCSMMSIRRGRSF